MAMRPKFKFDSSQQWQGNYCFNFNCTLFSTEKEMTA